MSTPHTDALAHVRWIGGSPCAGKTSIADALARRYGLGVYHFDRQETDHFQRRIAAGDAEASAFLSMSMDERWLDDTPAEMASTTIASWTRRFPLVVDDLLAMPRSAPIIAEGPGLFPECVAPLLSDPRHAVWLVPSRDFCEAVRRRRPGGAADQTSDPERALRNIVDRDALMAGHIRAQAESRGLRVIEVGGRAGMDEVGDIVDAWLFATR
jgi:hypothetical protein